MGFCLYVHMEKQTLRSFSSYYSDHCVLYRLLLVINISYGYLQLMLLLHQNFFVFFSISHLWMSLYRLWNVSVYFLFVCFDFFCFVFYRWGFWIRSWARVIFVSLCNIHFSVSVTFYLDRESRVLFFLCVVLSELVAFVWGAVQIPSVDHHHTTNCRMRCFIGVNAQAT